MLKKLNMLALVMLIASQTILGPMASAGVVFAEAGNNEGNDDDGSETTKIVEEVDKDDLEATIKDAEDIEKAEEDYTEASFTVFVKALTAGVEVVENADATQEDVNDAETEIEKAIKALQEETEPNENEGETEESTESEETNEDADAKKENSDESETEVVEEEEESAESDISLFADTLEPEAQEFKDADLTFNFGKIVIGNKEI